MNIRVHLGLTRGLTHPDPNRSSADWHPAPVLFLVGRKLDAVLTALNGLPAQVRSLDLGDAAWAQEAEYAKQLLQLLRRWKRSLSTLRLTSRALLQPCSSSRSKQQVGSGR